MSISIEPMTVEFFEVLLTHITEQTLQKISLAHYCGDEPDLQRVLIRPVSIKQQAHLSVVYRYQTRDITKNYLIEDAIALLKSWLGIHFKSAHVQASTEVMQWQLGKKNKVSLSRAVTVQQLENTQTHNREKQRYLDQSRPFLTALGITDQKQQIIPAMSRKWKQINKFVEIFSGAFADLKRDTDQPVRVVDFGSGKGYLTFAIRDYIEKTLNLKPQVTGVELRDELVGLCNRVVNDLSLDGLDFFQGDVRSFSPDAVDVMIALHACDIATDYALHTGIRLGASIIMCAPCCHKELRPQLKVPTLLKPMLGYGVHLGQQAEMLTDSMRALLLEAHGYETKVFEFVALEHTSKNKMILAVKKSNSAPKQAEVLAQVAALKAFYGVYEQTLERLLK
jgi:SAM-dependent methyltransferase